jgi:hypothetical protein
MGSVILQKRIGAEDIINGDYGALDSNTADAAWNNINEGNFSSTGPITISIPVTTLGAGVSYAVDEIRLRLKKTAEQTGTITVQLNSMYAEIDIEELSTDFEWVSIKNIEGNRIISGDVTLTIHSATGGIFWVDYIANALGSATTYWDTIGYALQDTSSGEYFTNASALQFEILGGTWDISLCTYNEYLRKVGVNASDTSKTVEFARDVCKQAECTLNARTKKNWSTIYDSLSDDLKEILNRIVSNLAAMEGINADMSGFSSRLEATSMIDYLRWGTEKLTNELKKEDLKNFITNPD